MSLAYSPISLALCLTASVILYMDGKVLQTDTTDEHHRDGERSWLSEVRDDGVRVWLNVAPGCKMMALKDFKKAGVKWLKLWSDFWAKVKCTIFFLFFHSTLPTVNYIFSYFYLDQTQRCGQIVVWLNCKVLLVHHKMSSVWSHSSMLQHIDVLLPLFHILSLLHP